MHVHVLSIFSENSGLKTVSARMHLFAKLYFIAKEDAWFILKYHIFSMIFFAQVFLKNNAANDELENSPTEAHGRVPLPFRTLNKIICFVSYDYDPP